MITATSRQPGVEITGHLVPCTLTCPLGRGSEAPAPLVRSSGKALVNLGWAMSLGRVVSTGWVGQDAPLVLHSSYAAAFNGNERGWIPGGGRTWSVAGGFSLYCEAFPCF